MQNLLTFLSGICINQMVKKKSFQFFTTKVIFFVRWEPKLLFLESFRTHFCKSYLLSQSAHHKTDLVWTIWRYNYFYNFNNYYSVYVTRLFYSSKPSLGKKNNVSFSRYFRVIPANEFLTEFASDRRHMKRPDGTWIKPPPNYPAISTAS